MQFEPSAFDIQCMKLAIAQSQQGMDGNFGGPFGAVIAQEGRIIAANHNRVVWRGREDPTAHGEITTIRAACRKLHTPWLEGSTLYTNCQPCPMCLTSSMWAHIRRIMFACTKEDAANIGFDDLPFYEQTRIEEFPEVIEFVQLMRAEAWEVMKQWPEKIGKKDY